MKFGRISRPVDYTEDELLDTVGYVKDISIEQENDTDAIWFHLTIYPRAAAEGVEPESTERYFRIFLDQSTSVALAQLQLLRDALRSKWDPLIEDNSEGPLLVRIHFNFDSTDRERGVVYWLAVIEGMGRYMSVESYYWRQEPSTWYAEGFPNPASQ